MREFLLVSAMLWACTASGQQSPQQPGGGFAVRPGRPVDLQKQVQLPRGYALVIGIGKYKNLGGAGQDLRFPESDAEAVSRVLISKEGGNIEPENVKKLIGKDATLANVRAALENWLPAVAQEQDRVIVYFAGHGLVADGRGYLAPYDVDVSNLAATAYPMDQLGNILSNKVKAKWKVLLTDACHSAKITAESTQQAVYNAVSKLPSKFLTLNSSREQESSYEDPALATGYGVFSYFVIQGWMGNADVNPRDGIVTADELVEYVRREVKVYARQRGSDQTPTEHGGDFPDDMLLGFSPQRRQQLASAGGAGLADGVLVIEVNLDNVEVYVDDKLIGTASPGKNLEIPGLSSGQHVIKGVRLGYDPVSKEELVSPGERRTVTLRIQYARRIKKTAQDLYHEGREIFKRRKSEADLKRAASLFERALKEDDKYSAAALELCRTLQQLNDTDIAKKACVRAVDLDPDYEEARTQLGAILIEAGDTKEAISQLAMATTQNKQDPIAHALLGEAFLLTESYDKAEEAASKGISVSPQYSYAYLVRGDARRFQKRYNEARDDYSQYLKLDNFDARFYEWIPYLIGSGLSKKSAGYKAIYKNQRSSAFFGLCWCEMSLHNFNKASEYCEKAVSIDAEDGVAQNLLGTVYLELFNRDNRRSDLLKAKQSLQLAVKLMPDSTLAAEAKANLKGIEELLPRVK